MIFNNRQFWFVTFYFLSNPETTVISIYDTELLPSVNSLVGVSFPRSVLVFLYCTLSSKIKEKRIFKVANNL